MSIAQQPSEPEGKLQVRSIRKQPFFWIPNDVYDKFHRVLGLQGLGLYATLARYANNATGTCWPSLARLSQELNCTPKTLRGYLDLLVEHHLIALDASPGKPTVIWMLDPSKNDQGRESQSPEQDKAQMREETRAPATPMPAPTIEATPVKIPHSSSNNTNNTKTIPSSFSSSCEEEEEQHAPLPNPYTVSEAERDALCQRNADGIAALRALLYPAEVAAERAEKPAPCCPPTPDPCIHEHVTPDETTCIDCGEVLTCPAA